MTYFKVDDHFHSHQKVLELPLEAVGLWTLAGSWAGEQLTDGFIPKPLINRLGGSREIADVLVDAGLWYVVDNGYQFHDWDAHNKTKDQVLEDRQKWKIKNDRRKSYRDQGDTLGGSPSDTLSDTPGDTDGVTPGVTPELPGTRNMEQGTRSLIKNKEEKFAEFWQNYPRKVGKQAAAKAFYKALKDGFNPDEINEGLKRYINDPNMPEGQYIPHPQTWLNQGRWMDEAMAIPRVAPVSNRERTLREADRLIAEARERESVWGNFNGGREITA